MAPLWLNVLGWAAIAAAAVSAGWTGFHVVVRRRRQHMRIMEVVWPRHCPLLLLRAARHMGIPTLRPAGEHRLVRRAPERARLAQPKWAGIATDVSHCGAGCTLGDLIAEWCVFGIGATIAGLALLPEYIGDYLAALTLGIFFRYFAIAPMRGPRAAQWPRRGGQGGHVVTHRLRDRPLRLDGACQQVLFPHPHLSVDSSAYWSLMQIGMVFGFVTSWPANVWLIRKGIEEPM